MIYFFDANFSGHFTEAVFESQTTQELAPSCRWENSIRKKKIKCHKEWLCGQDGSLFGWVFLFIQVVFKMLSLP